MVGNQLQFLVGRRSLKEQEAVGYQEEDKNVKNSAGGEDSLEGELGLKAAKWFHVTVNEQKPACHAERRGWYTIRGCGDNHG